MTSPMVPTARLTSRLVQLRVRPYELTHWRRAAVAEDRSLSAMIRTAVREHVRGNVGESERDERLTG